MIQASILTYTTSKHKLLPHTLFQVLLCTVQEARLADLADRLPVVGLQHPLLQLRVRLLLGVRLPVLLVRLPLREVAPVLLIMVSVVGKDGPEQQRVLRHILAPTLMLTTLNVYNVIYL